MIVMEQNCILAVTVWNIHTIVLWLFWILPGTTQVGRYPKGKTNLDLLEQEIVSGSVISWTV